MTGDNLEYDLIIAGGGINGAALARLAAFQGLQVALFEAGDFGQGASSNTSKMLHGGLRYLETFDFGLVRDAVRERVQLLDIAPHLVEAKHFLFPNNKLGRHSRPGIKAGLMLYDIMALNLKIDSHRWVSSEEVKKLEPHFLPEEDCGAYEYSDCVMDDARMVLENLIDAQSLGANIFNYQSIQGIERVTAERKIGSYSDGVGKINGVNSDTHFEVTVLDRLTGKEIVHRGKRVALTLGPWTDEWAKTNFPQEKLQVKLSQGIHLVVDGLESKACFILPVPKSKRYFFVLPWKGKHLVGTTETEVGAFPPKPIVPHEAEIQELKNLLQIYFPRQKPKQICTITGLRPLARSKKSGTISLSREHEFHKLDEGIFSAVGGKYTTYRTFAHDFLKNILAKDKSIKDIKPRMLPGAWKGSEGKTLLQSTLMDNPKYPFMNMDLCVVWMRRYGIRALEIANFVSELSGDGGERISSLNPILRGEVYFAIEREWAKTPTDFFRRRTDLYFTLDGGKECYEKVKEIFLNKFPNLENTLGVEADYLAFLKQNLHNAA